MLFSLLFLGLLPVAFMAGSFAEDPFDDADDEAAGHGTEPAPPSGNGDVSYVSDVLLPNTSDQLIPGQSTGDPDEVLTPNNGLGDGETPHQEASLLDRLLATETDSHYGREDLGSFLGDLDEAILTDSGDHAELGDGNVDATGSGSIDDFHGSPILQSGDGSAVDVLDGGEGDDTLIAGDGAAYLFGNDGDDAIMAGDGVLAAFGGDGADRLDGSHSLDSFLDGGVGDDTLLGGDGDDQLFGGIHEETEHTEDRVADDDVLVGGAGNDQLHGGFGADVLTGGDGNDTLNHLGHAMERSGAELHNFDWHIDGDQDRLDGGLGNDTLIMDRADIATGGDGEDVFWIYSDAEAGEDYAEVTDFVPGQDFLRVSLNPNQETGDLDYDVRPSDTGEDGIVIVNGEVVAVLKGAPGATTHDIYVEVTPVVFR